MKCHFDLKRFLLLLYFSALVQMADSLSHTSVEIGGVVTLPCNGTEYRNTPVDHMDILWETQDQLIGHYIGGTFSVGTGYENRVEMNEQKIREGNFSLTITPVTYSDSDVYECYWGFSRSDKKFLQNVQLDVTASITTHTSVPVGERVTLSCYGHIYRQVKINTVYIQWKKDGEQVLLLESGKVTLATGYQNRTSVSLDRIRLGDLSLTINNTRMSDQGLHTCLYKRSGGLEEGNPKSILLSVTAHQDNVTLQHGETLQIRLYTAEKVEILLTRDVSVSPVSVCSVEENQAQCGSNYTHRVSVHNNTLTLVNVTPADVGNYTVWEVKTSRTISSISLTVTAEPKDSKTWLTIVAGISTVVVMAVGGIYCFCKNRTQDPPRQNNQQQPEEQPLQDMNPKPAVRDESSHGEQQEQDDLNDEQPGE